MRNLTLRCESWPLKEPFVISRLTQATAELVVVEITEDGHLGRGECERADAFEATAPKVVAAIEAARPAIESGIDRPGLDRLMAAGPARAAVDCAL